MKDKHFLICVVFFSRSGTHTISKQETEPLTPPMRPRIIHPVSNPVSFSYKLFLHCALQLLLLASLPAQAPKATPVPPSPQMAATSESSVAEPVHQLTAEDLHAFLDGFMPMQLEREDIAGAVVLVVKDGQILFSKCYGFSY